jgi:hypothetical protein
MKTKIITGYDPGRMYSKLFTIIDGKEIKLKGPNGICIGYERRIDDKALSKELELNAEDLLDVTITKDNIDSRYFVGEFARKNHRSDLLTSSNGVRKFNGITGDKERSKLYTYQALAAYKAGKKELIVRTGLGAPTEEFYDEMGEKELAEFEKLTGEVVVKFNHPKFQGYEVKLIPDGMDFAPEGTASTFSARYDIDLVTLELKEVAWMKEQLSKGAVYISNLGSSTEDCAILTSSGFDGKGSFGIPIGSSIATTPLQQDLDKLYNYDKDKTTLDYHLQLTAPQNKNIRYKGNVIDLNQMALPFFSSMIERRLQLTYDKLSRNGVDSGDIVAQFQTGGTVDYLKMINMDQHLQLFPHAELKISTRPHDDEARGYYIMSKQKYDYEKTIAAAKHDIDHTDTLGEMEIVEVS